MGETFRQRQTRALDPNEERERQGEREVSRSLDYHLSGDHATVAIESLLLLLLLGTLVDDLDWHQCIDSHSLLSSPVSAWCVAWAIVRKRVRRTSNR